MRIALGFEDVAARVTLAVVATGGILAAAAWLLWEPPPPSPPTTRESYEAHVGRMAAENRDRQSAALLGGAAMPVAGRAPGELPVWPPLTDSAGDR